MSKMVYLNGTVKHGKESDLLTEMIYETERCYVVTDDNVIGWKNMALIQAELHFQKHRIKGLHS